jgi:hypothetical protein
MNTYWTDEVEQSPSNPEFGPLDDGVGIDESNNPPNVLSAYNPKLIIPTRGAMKVTDTELGLDMFEDCWSSLSDHEVYLLMPTMCRDAPFSVEESSDVCSIR